MALDIAKIRKLMGDDRGVISRTAEAMGVKRANLSRILSGKFDPRLSTIELLAGALGCKPKDILR